MVKKRSDKMRWLLLLLVAVVAALLLAATLGDSTMPAGAQTSAGYNLEWHVIGGGGEAMGSASYAVNGTAGQPAAGPPLLTSARYTVSGGYWFSSSNGTYLPLTVKAP